MNYSTLYQRSIADRDGFWHEQAARIDWRRRFEQVCDHSNPPFARWFVGGLTNLCHNAVDRHVIHRADQPALIHVSASTGADHILSYGQLFVEVQRMAAVLKNLGVVKGDRVLIDMPMMLEAVIAMLATVRLGAIHSVVYGGFSAQVLANRIDDMAPRVIATADAGARAGQVQPYKPRLDEALSGYAVALATAMDQIYDGRAGETFFGTGDISSDGGHGCIVYGPLIAGMATIVYEGLSSQSGAATWWSLVEKYQVTVMFSVPTAIRELRKHNPAVLEQHDLSSLKHLFLAGEPLDEHTARWISAALGKPVVDNYWQTETGWPVLAVARGVQPDQPTIQAVCEGRDPGDLPTIENMAAVQHLREVTDSQA